MRRLFAANEFGVQIVIDPQVFAHVLVVDVLILIAREVQAKLVDDLRALADPRVPGFGRDVLVNPMTDGAAERRLGQLRAGFAGSAADEAARG